MLFGKENVNVLIDCLRIIQCNQDNLPFISFTLKGILTSLIYVHCWSEGDNRLFCLLCRTSQEEAAPWQLYLRCWCPGREASKTPSKRLSFDTDISVPTRFRLEPNYPFQQMVSVYTLFTKNFRLINCKCWRCLNSFHVLEPQTLVKFQGRALEWQN